MSPAEQVIPVPGDLSDDDAAQALVNPITAWVMTMVEHDLSNGSAKVSEVHRTVGYVSGSSGKNTLQAGHDQFGSSITAVRDVPRAASDYDCRRLHSGLRSVR